MKTEGTNLLLLTISAFWSSSRWPLATKMSSRRQRSIPLGGRYRQVLLYFSFIRWPFYQHGQCWCFTWYMYQIKIYVCKCRYHTFIVCRKIVLISTDWINLSSTYFKKHIPICSFMRVLTFSPLNLSAILGVDTTTLSTIWLIAIALSGCLGWQCTYGSGRQWPLY